MPEEGFTVDTVENAFREVFPLVFEKFGVEPLLGPGDFRFRSNQEVNRFDIPDFKEIYFLPSERLFIVEETEEKSTPYSALGHEAGHIARWEQQFSTSDFYRSVDEFYAVIAERAIAEEYGEVGPDTKIDENTRKFPFPGYTDWGKMELWGTLNRLEVENFLPELERIFLGAAYEAAYRASGEHYPDVLDEDNFLERSNYKAWTSYGIKDIELDTFYSLLTDPLKTSQD